VTTYVEYFEGKRARHANILTETTYTMLEFGEKLWNRYRGWGPLSPR